MKLFKRVILFLLFSVTIAYFYFSRTLVPFTESHHPQEPDYTNKKNWSAFPFRNDAADFMLDNEIWVNDTLKKVDVFYIYPTMYVFGKNWNADITSNFLNFVIDNLPVKYHASVFNQVARVYAPRYRQAIHQSYSDTSGSGKKALNFAYEDVKTAFKYYLKYYNNGRPIIIASHSQGTTHTRKLLKDFFDTPEMKTKLVCAYVVGSKIYKEEYEILTPCNDSTETNCYVTWSSFKEGFSDESVIKKYSGNVCVNPVSWKTDSLTYTTNNSVFRNINSGNQFTTQVRVTGSHLSVKADNLWVMSVNVLHDFDFNLFWFDIRKNVSQRVDAYFENLNKPK